jgi:hypothetical protein
LYLKKVHFSTHFHLPGASKSLEVSGTRTDRLVKKSPKFDNKWIWAYNTCIESIKGAEMNLSNAVARDMQRTREINIYGMTEQDIRTQYMESITAKCSGLEMVVMGIMSDCQEMMAMGTGPRSVEYVRQQMNVAKFILSEMMDQKEAQI